MVRFNAFPLAAALRLPAAAYIFPSSTTAWKWSRGTRRVGQLAPLARPRIERIQPRHVPARVAELMSSHQVNQPVVHGHSGAASETIRRDGRPFLPAIGRGIVDVHIRQRRLPSSRSGERAEHVDLPVVHHRLEVMHDHRRHGAGFPRPGCGVEDLHRLRRLAGADEIEPLTDLDVAGLESRDCCPTASRCPTAHDRPAARQMGSRPA